MRDEEMAEKISQFPRWHRKTNNARQRKMYHSL